MTNIILLTLSLAAEGFLLYALLQFARALRRNRAARRQTTIVWSLDALRKNATSSLQASKVISIPALSRRSSASPFASRAGAGHILSGKQ